MMNREQETIFAKLDEVKRDIAGGVTGDYNRNSFAEEEHIDIFETFYDADKKQMHKLFWHNQKTGACGYREYTEEGADKQTMDYSADGQLTVCYFQKGLRVGEIGYKNGLLNGPYSRKLSDNIIEKGMYADGKRKPTTQRLEFYDNGHLKEFTHYYNGLKDGESFTYYPNGKRHEEMKFYDGKKVFGYVSYYPNGNVQEETYYSNGQKNGYCFTFREDGTKIRAAYYKNDELNGICSDYDEQNRVTQIGCYKDGRLNGTLETFDKDGSLVSRVVYANGRKLTPPNLSLSGRLKSLSHVSAPIVPVSSPAPTQEQPSLSPHILNGGR